MTIPHLCAGMVCFTVIAPGCDAYDCAPCDVIFTIPCPTPRDSAYKYITDRRGVTNAKQTPMGRDHILARCNNTRMLTSAIMSLTICSARSTVSGVPDMVNTRTGAPFAMRNTHSWAIVDVFKSKQGLLLAHRHQKGKIIPVSNCTRADVSLWTRLMHSPPRPITLPTRGPGTFTYEVIE
jgi:hypothetical protein